MYRLPHYVHLASVGSLVLGLEVFDLEAVVLPQADPGVLPHDEVTRGQHAAGSLPHDDKLAQI